MQESWFYGVPEVKFIGHGEFADPEVEYKGLRFNYFRLEDALSSMYCEDDRRYEEFECFIKENPEIVYEILDMLIAEENNVNEH